ncbi:DNA-3-methyladenine glycosylase 2 family protein [Tianweitania sp. BSSL-BM11]|uniref:DNA-3-methyladenine glycosylase II n=1 Tax=Tianweitania aestuarii TaxID=2814886 RepID=A0ABS5RZA9_9HYPH|nr:DNA-3-methyladenine glycosylase [Tianweitania aestuarii]MBS9722393.1 DNA-3-methyladenine glycosylase 2 family protein [Tianweitania aestuarii]
MRRIETLEHVGEDLDALVAADPRLVPVHAAAGEIPLRLVPPGFASLAGIITSQQVSRASADAIFARFLALVDPLTPETLLAAPETVFREAGQSRAKQRTLLALAQACVEGRIRLDAMREHPAEQAIADLTAVPGIGPWTAEVYLMFCAGHPDIFPAHDVALQTAVGDALAIAPRPSAKALAKVAEAWSPHRSVAARLFWAYYAVIRRRDALPLG